jgi:SAM-dependent methyltransferase
MSERAADEVRDAVRRHYGAALTAKPEPNPGACCAPGCCTAPRPESTVAAGYAEAELALLPSGANLGMGCGNPVLHADLRAGETVLDLGCGAGIDCFLAVRRVGAEGRVIGVDATPEMIARARAGARAAGVVNVEFHLGEMERLPIADASVDVVLSNCAINLSPAKARVFGEAYRVLRPGGRLAVADVVRTVVSDRELQPSPEDFAGCLAGAVPAADVERLLHEAGFAEVSVSVDEGGPGPRPASGVASATIAARKPLGTRRGSAAGRRRRGGAR